MFTITIEAEETLVTALEEIAQQKQTTIEDIAKEALLQYLQQYPSPGQPYSFIGIGHSGKKDLSSQAEIILTQVADRREGWSLPE
jgi:hypothetical protein